MLVLTYKDQKNRYLFLNTYDGFIAKINKAMKVDQYWYLGNFLPEKICPPPLIRVGVWARRGLALGLGSNQTMAPKENCPLPCLVRVRIWLQVSFGDGGQFFFGAIFPEPLPVRKFILCFLYHILHKCT